MGIERAKIYELDPKGGKLPNDNGIDVCFNPKEYTYDKSLSWDSSKALSDAPMPEFKSPSAMTLAVTLQFDTYEERVSVRAKYVKRLEQLTYMKKKAKDDKDIKNQMPPMVLWVWGKQIFKGVITKLSQKYTMFLSDGTPVRCEVALSIQQVEEDIKGWEKITVGQARKSGTRNVPVNDGDRLDSIAADKLGDASRWGEIAALNGIEDPVNITDSTGKRKSNLDIPNE
jgi:hypothetical protein